MLGSRILRLSHYEYLRDQRSVTPAAAGFGDLAAALGGQRHAGRRGSGCGCAHWTALSPGPSATWRATVSYWPYAMSSPHQPPVVLSTGLKAGLRLINSPPRPNRVPPTP